MNHPYAVAAWLVGFGALVVIGCIIAKGLLWHPTLTPEQKLRAANERLRMGRGR